MTAFVGVLDAEHHLHRRAGIDLADSYAYADSYSDRPLLEAVGNPAAVNPDPSLYRHAKRKHWRIYEWGAHTRGRGDVLIDTIGTIRGTVTAR